MKNIFLAWDEFVRGKRQKTDVQKFGRYLEDNLFDLQKSLQDKTYQHYGYHEFYVRDPKIRHIHKACVKDRIVHHLVSKVLEEIFEPTFYVHSYSCRKNKGTHKAVKTLVKMTRKASKNNSSSLFILKCDIKKYFASVDHNILIKLIKKQISDNNFIMLVLIIIKSFNIKNCLDKGMPIGNLTSQFFANIYLDPLDKYVKHNLGVKYYLRYADDFVLLADNKNDLNILLTKIEKYLNDTLKLFLHPNKIEIRDYYLGIDFLGYVIFPNYIIPRTKTKKRIFKKLNDEKMFNQRLQSYLGYLSHCNGYKLAQRLKNMEIIR